MRILVRDVSTGEVLGPSGGWTTDLGNGQAFATGLRAMEAAQGIAERELEVLFWFDNPELDIHFRVRSSGPGKRKGGAKADPGL